MELIILGTNTDDKGTQLENLTRYLLGELGYTDIVVNEIRAGGQEIDVRAERRFLSPGGEQTYRVICECKALKIPIAMPDWLKFLGKVHVEEAQLNRQVNACLIALSGVNGNVAGSFDALCETGERIELITGDGLVRLLSRTFTIIPLPEVVDHVRGYTSRQITHFSLCYYERRVYWLVEFEHKSFSLLDHEGSPLTPDSSADLQPLLADHEDVGEYLDLVAECYCVKKFL